MRAKLIRVIGLSWLFIALVQLSCATVHAQAADMKFQAFLLWGTDDRKPPEDKSYTSVAPDVMHKLKSLPLKWTNWFEVNHKDFAVQQDIVKEVPISERCQLNVKRISGTDVEVLLLGKGKGVVKRQQSLPKGEMLVLGGNAPNATAWLVVLKRIE